MGSPLSNPLPRLIGFGVVPAPPEGRIEASASWPPDGPGCLFSSCPRPTAKTAWQARHLTYFPVYELSARRCVPHLGHENTCIVMPRSRPRTVLRRLNHDRHTAAYPNSQKGARRPRVKRGRASRAPAQAVTPSGRRRVSQGPSLAAAPAYFSARTEVRMKSDRPRKPLERDRDSRTAFSSGVTRMLICTERLPSRAGSGGRRPCSSM